jgi:hypothetical protein
MLFLCDCYMSDRCRQEATRVLIDAKGRPRLSCHFHTGFPDFDYTREENVLPVPFDDLPVSMRREWLAAERDWQRKLREKIRKLEALLQESEIRAGVSPAVSEPASAWQGELALV